MYKMQTALWSIDTSIILSQLKGLTRYLTPANH